MNTENNTPNNPDNSPAPAPTWAEINNALDLLTDYVRHVQEDDGIAWTCNFSDVERMAKVIGTVEVSIPRIREQFADDMAVEIQTRLSEVENFRSFRAGFIGKPHGQIEGEPEWPTTFKGAWLFFQQGAAAEWFARLPNKSMRNNSWELLHEYKQYWKRCQIARSLTVKKPSLERVHGLMENVLAMEGLTADDLNAYQLEKKGRLPFGRYLADHNLPPGYRRSDEDEVIDPHVFTPEAAYDDGKIKGELGMGEDSCFYDEKGPADLLSSWKQGYRDGVAFREGNREEVSDPATPSDDEAEAKAYDDGKFAGEGGESRNACPFTNQDPGNLVSAWYRGYNVGVQHRKSNKGGE